MQMDVWYDALQELLEAKCRISELLEDAQATLETETEEED